MGEAARGAPSEAPEWPLESLGPAPRVERTVRSHSCVLPGPTLLQPGFLWGSRGRMPTTQQKLRCREDFLKMAKPVLEESGGLSEVMPGNRP